MNTEITVKFHKTDLSERRKKQIQLLLGNSVVKVLQIFPNDLQLSTLYQVILNSNKTLGLSLNLLLKDESIEYAHESAKRHIV